MVGGHQAEQHPQHDEVQQQLAYLLSTVPALAAENAELKQFAAQATKRIDDLAAVCDQLRRESAAPSATAAAAAQQAGSHSPLPAHPPTLSRSPSIGLGTTGSIGPSVTSVAAEVSSLRSELDELRGGMEVQLEELRERCEGATAEAAAATHRSAEAAALAEQAAEAAAAASTQLPTAAAPAQQSLGGAPEQAEPAPDAAASGPAAEERLAALQDSMIAMAAGLEQEQAALREQVGHGPSARVRPR